MYKRQGQSGFARNLSPSEILSQVQAASVDAGERISHIVLMGMGEPLDNYENVLRFLELVTSEEGLNVSMRHISLSTCGLVDKIYDLADKKLQLTLSVSLHAPNDEIRSCTMPVKKRWNMEQLLKACRYYSTTTGRRISFEYAMISGVNDMDWCARELASLRGACCIHKMCQVKSMLERLRECEPVKDCLLYTSSFKRSWPPWACPSTGPNRCTAGSTGA